MSYSEEVKQLAYKMDPECWLPYAGCAKVHRRAMDTRRNLSLEAARRYVDNREIVKAAHRLQNIVEYQIVLTKAIGDNPFSLYFEKDNGKAVPPKKHMLHGRELKVRDVVVYQLIGEPTRTTVVGFTATHVQIATPGGAIRITIPLEEVEGVLPWLEETPDTQAELQHRYNTVITDMCKGTTVKPWECVRFVGKESPFRVIPSFNLVKSGYEFALTVHLNRPVWVGSVLYNRDTGVQHTVRNLTHHGKGELLHTSAEGGREGDIDWRDWAVWDKPVKQKVPTRVKVGEFNRRYVSVPDALVKSERIVRLFFTTSKDADEFYEVFKNLTGEKEA